MDPHTKIYIVSAILLVLFAVVLPLFMKTRRVSGEKARESESATSRASVGQRQANGKRAA